MHCLVPTTSFLHSTCPLQLVVYGVDPKAAASEAAEKGCTQRIVLLPFGADKQDLEEYKVRVVRQVPT
jgi:hypothetical protein